jgi:hypothetical protein
MADLAAEKAAEREAAGEETDGLEEFEDGQ